jgi:hypothetical protein
MELDGNSYQIGKMDLFDQIHVARKIAPAISGLGESISLIQDKLKHLSDVDEDQEAFFNKVLWSGSGPITEALSQMKEEDVNYVMKKCLSVVMRLDKISNRWSKVTASNGQPMYQDIDMLVMMRLVWAVIQDNLGSFFQNRPGQPTVGAE